MGNTEVKDSGEAIQWVLSYAIHVEKMGTLHGTAKIEGEDLNALSVIHVEKRDT